MTENYFETDFSEATTWQSIGNSSKDRNAWNAAIARLLSWRQDPSQLADEEIEPPTVQIIALACSLAVEMRDNNGLGPLRVVPDGEGGISFERLEGAILETIDIDATGSIEVFSFENSRLINRRLLSLHGINAGIQSNTNSGLMSHHATLASSTNGLDDETADFSLLSAAARLEPAA